MLVFVLTVVVKITKISFAKSACKKTELAQSIKAHFQSQIPENLTKNPKILREIAEIFNSKNLRTLFSELFTFRIK